VFIIFPQVLHVPTASLLMIHSRKYFQDVLQNNSKYGLLETESSESLKCWKKNTKTLGRCRHTKLSALVKKAYFIWHIWQKRDNFTKLYRKYLP